MESQISVMRYIQVTRFGKPDVLQLAEKPCPSPQSGEVLIKVYAAGVNRADLVQRAGRYPMQGNQMPLLGLEVSGEIAGIGMDVHNFQLGEKVCALVNGGGYAEYVATPAAQCLPVPEGISLAEAAAVPEAAMTVWSNIFADSRLPRAGQFFLVHGGSSGVGTFAIQLGKAWGLRVLTTVSSADKCREAMALGAELAIDYHQEDFADRVRKYTDPEGVHVILDMIGGDYTAKNIRLLALDGRLAQIAFQQGADVTISLADMMLRQARITGSLLSRRTQREKAAMTAALLQHVWPLYENGAIKVVIQQSFPLQEVAQAHQAMHRGGHTGKYILLI